MERNLNAQSGAFSDMPYTFKTRFENDNGTLELILKN